MMKNKKKMPKKYMKAFSNIFIMNSPPLTRDVICSKLKRDGKVYWLHFIRRAQSIIAKIQNFCEAKFNHLNPLKSFVTLKNIYDIFQRL